MARTSRDRRSWPECEVLDHGLSSLWMKARCTAGKERRITRWEHKHVLEAVQRRLDENPQKMRQRRETVEHPFGTIKARMGATHCLMKTLPRVATEMALHVLAYNLTRIMNIMGMRRSSRRCGHSRRSQSVPATGHQMRQEDGPGWFMAENPQSSAKCQAARQISVDRCRSVLASVFLHNQDP